MALEKKEKMTTENRVLPVCRFTTLAMLSGDVNIPVGEGSVRIRQVGALMRVKPTPSRLSSHNC